MEETIKKIKRLIYELEGLILAVIALIILLLAQLGIIEYVVSITTILIILCLLVIHETLKSLKEKDSIKDITEGLKKIQEEQYKIIDKIDKARAAGFRGIHKKREDFVKGPLYSRIKFSKKKQWL